MREGDGQEPDWRALAMPGTTAVFYMGLARLDHIVAKLLEHGAAADTAGRHHCAGHDARTSASLPRLSPPFGGAAAEAKFESPALLVVGEVVALHSTLAWFGTAAGADQTAVVSRP